MLSVLVAHLKLSTEQSPEKSAALSTSELLPTDSLLPAAESLLPVESLLPAESLLPEESLSGYESFLDYLDRSADMQVPCDKSDTQLLEEVDQLITSVQSLSDTLRQRSATNNNTTKTLENAIHSPCDTVESAAGN